MSSVITEAGAFAVERARRAPRHSSLAWDSDTQRYYYPKGRAPDGQRAGRFLKNSSIRETVEADIERGRKRLLELGAEVRAIGRRYEAGEITEDEYRAGVSQWRDDMHTVVKDLHLNNATAARGGHAQMGPAQYGRVGQALKFHYERLDNFALEVGSDPALLRDGAEGRMPFLDRVGMYADTALFAYERERVASHTEEGYREYRNVLHSNDPCLSRNGRMGCVQVTARGWQKIGNLPEIGQRTCGPADLCTWEFRRGRGRPRKRRG